MHGWAVPKDCQDKKKTATKFAECGKNVWMRCFNKKEIYGWRVGHKHVDKKVT